MIFLLHMQINVQGSDSVVIAIKLLTQNSIMALFMVEKEENGETEQGQETSELLQTKDHSVWISHIDVQVLH